MPAIANWRGLTLQITALLFVAILLGGGGVAYGLANFTIQLTALGLLAFHRDAFVRFWKEAAIALRIAVALTLLTPILQLVPLPPNIWTALPGRELAVDARAALGPLQWHPVSLDSGRTLVALFGLIVPLAVLVIGMRAATRSLVWAGWGVVALGLLNFLIGIPQVLSPGPQWLLFPENPMSGVLFGTFANRNSAGVFLVACLSLLLHLPAVGRFTQSKMARGLVALLIVLAIVLTQSRSAMVLSLLPLASVFVRWGSQYWSKIGLTKPIIAIAAIGALIVVALTAIAFSPGSRLDTSLERFSSGNDARQFIWEDAGFSAQKFWPIGSGMGTFDEVFQADESLENLSSKTAGRAHNDYLEIAIEAGFLGLMLIAVWVILIGWNAWKARKLPDPWLAWSGGLIWLVIAFQSISDYPLRSQAGLALAAFSLLLLCHKQQSTREASA